LSEERTRRRIFLLGTSLIAIALINGALVILPKPCGLTVTLFNLGGAIVTLVLLIYGYFLVKFSREEWPPSPEELNEKYKKELNELMEFVEKEAPHLLYREKEDEG